jgi:hypothetical protein
MTGALGEWIVGVKYIGQGEMKFSGFSPVARLKPET